MSGHDTKRCVCHASTTGKRTVRLLYAVVGDSLQMCFGGPRACGSMACSGHATETIGLMHALVRICAWLDDQGFQTDPVQAVVPVFSLPGMDELS
jgi:hypothetical protein